MSEEITSLLKDAANNKYYNTNISANADDYRHAKLLISDESDVSSTSAEPARTWVGMSSQELRQFSQDPFWVHARLVCFVLAWFTFLSLLIASIVITVQAPRCHVLDWWQRGPIYNVLAPSFMDSDNSGRGDLEGIESKLDYVAGLGVNIVWLSPIYKSPMKDFGYDIQDFKDIDPIFGNIDDFKRLVAAMKQRDMKLVMDFVPNHSSDNHEWFKKSVARQDPYTDYYVWANAKSFKDGKPQPPNNWISVFGGSAWEWNGKRKQFYYHQFAVEQPDLNFRNRAVINEMLDVLRFWLALGVDGFRVDSVPHLFEDKLLRDEPLSNHSGSSPLEYDYLSHIYTQHLPEVTDVLKEFKAVLANYSENGDGIKRLFMVEVYGSVKETVKYYGDPHSPISDFPFNFLFLTDLNKTSSAHDAKSTIDTWYSHMPHGSWANWVLGNHDRSRVATRFGSDMIDALHMIVLLLPGTPVTYYGEEIGMEDAEITWDDTIDPAGRQAGQDNYRKHTRDPERTPMQWTGGKNGGFSEAEKTWLPVNPNYKQINVEAEETEPSHLNVYKNLVKIRKENSVMYGNLDIKVLNNNTVLAFTRIQSARLSYAVAVNWGNDSQIVDLREFPGMSTKAQVYTKSVNFKAGDSKYFDTKEIPLGPKEGIVLMFTPEASKYVTDSGSGKS